MNFFQIKAFCCVADRESFTTASEYLFVSTSCLSKTIQSLETELDVILFNRGRSKVTLTAAGHCFYQYAQTVTLQRTNMLQQLSQYQNHRKNHIRIALTTSQRYYSLLAPITSFQAENKNLSISVVENEKDTILKKLDSNEVDLAISWDDEGHRVSHHDYDVYYFKKENRVLMCNIQHPLAKETCVSLSDARDYAFVFPSNILQQTIYTELCEKNGFTPQVTAYYSSIGTQFDLVEQNFGLSFILETMASVYAHPDVCTVGISPPVFNNLAIIRKKGQTNRLSQQFIDYYLEFMRKKYGDLESD